MYSKQQIDTLLQTTEKIVRIANEQDIALLMKYVRTHLKNEELLNKLKQTKHYDIYITKESEVQLSFSIKPKKAIQRYELEDTLFLFIPK